MPGVEALPHEPEKQDEAEPLGACNKAEPCYKKKVLFKANGPLAKMARGYPFYPLPSTLCLLLPSPTLLPQRPQNPSCSLRIRRPSIFPDSLNLSPQAAQFAFQVVVTPVEVV